MVSVGRIEAEVTADASRFARDMRLAENSVRGVDAQIGRLEGSFGGLARQAGVATAGIGAFVAGIGAATREMVELARTVGEEEGIARSIGLIREEYLRLVIAIQANTGLARNEAGDLLRVIQEFYSEALIEPDGPQAEAFARLGADLETIRRGATDTRAAIRDLFSLVNQFEPGIARGILTGGVGGEDSARIIEAVTVFGDRFDDAVSRLEEFFGITASTEQALTALEEAWDVTVQQFRDSAANFLAATGVLETATRLLGQISVRLAESSTAAEDSRVKEIVGLEDALETQVSNLSSQISGLTDAQFAYNAAQAAHDESLAQFLAAIERWEVLSGDDFFETVFGPARSARSQYLETFFGNLAPQQRIRVEGAIQIGLLNNTLEAVAIQLENLGNREFEAAEEVGRTLASLEGEITFLREYIGRFPEELRQRADPSLADGAGIESVVSEVLQLLPLSRDDATDALRNVSLAIGKLEDIETHQATLLQGLINLESQGIDVVIDPQVIADEIRDLRQILEASGTEIGGQLFELPPGLVESLEQQIQSLLSLTLDAADLAAATARDNQARQKAAEEERLENFINNAKEALEAERERAVVIRRFAAEQAALERDRLRAEQESARAAARAAEAADAALARIAEHGERIRAQDLAILAEQQRLLYEFQTAGPGNEFLRIEASQTMLDPATEQELRTAYEQTLEDQIVLTDFQQQGIVALSTAFSNFASTAIGEVDDIESAFEAFFRSLLGSLVSYGAGRLAQGLITGAFGAGGAEAPIPTTSPQRITTNVNINVDGGVTGQQLQQAIDNALPRVRNEIQATVERYATGGRF